ncbi:hypothetical protein QIP80_gp3 [ssRNA phage Gephyllon.1_16]|uniref:Uncharacterized protein n=2 Tax=Leviviricetes TaxID=2842243 RepID=A0A8S5L2N8_9VIRU|nr:hypothetical protein QIP80_gp3 [ssRNA phage Gephyllon.1_16]QDH89767.1 MAG: hypothetical protein H1BulkLitter5738_000002 [Leviviridae sp.]DAD51921.1 TPA_asm: hypothetical protein [ssRNA phage Gephyllon.1_16]
MASHGSYDSDTVIAFTIRLYLILSFLAVMPFLIAGCAKDGPSGGRLNATTSAEYQQFNSAGGSADQTRNLLPQRGTDEKSDSSLTKPSQ